MLRAYSRDDRKSMGKIKNREEREQKVSKQLYKMWTWKCFQSILFIYLFISSECLFPFWYQYQSYSFSYTRNSVFKSNAAVLFSIVWLSNWRHHRKKVKQQEDLSAYETYVVYYRKVQLSFKDVCKTTEHLANQSFIRKEK